MGKRIHGGKCLIAVCALTLLSGCWDRVEIDERGFVTGVAIDLVKKKGEEANEESSAQQFKGTYQIIVPAGLRSGGNESGGGGESYFNISASERSIMALTARLATKTSRTPYFEHLAIIVLSKDVVKGKSADLADLLDFFLRDNEMRRDVKVLITDGKASDIFNIKSQNEKYPLAYIESTLKNNFKSNYMLPPSRIGDIHEQILKDISFTIQKISHYEDGISLVGAALFGGDHAFVGFLSGEETQGLNFMRQQIKGGVVETQMDEQIVDFEVERAKSEIHAYPDGDSFRFVIKVRAEGALGKSIRNLDVAKLSTITAMEEAFAKKIEAVCYETITALQKEYNTDAIGLLSYLRQNHYRSWLKLKDNWDEGENLFSDAKIEVQAKVNIRRLGNINQSEGE
ncbi:spore germination protein [Paenibacillus phyllosphaerae]|uniref:Spore germination protein n=1 Tax=Paenibacillus phyllosphaerae TaxID=274593 RepID=A0A7W5FQH5_9BACL|nr:Ger(x)C family spore germination protein [Paenibacillus phyllosphaerae]MBB3113293.1 spore germination protein [Paenibacillus phyllosphaerae]